jgi:hypothetical protein
MSGLDLISDTHSWARIEAPRSEAEPASPSRFCGPLWHACPLAGRQCWSEPPPPEDLDFHGLATEKPLELPRRRSISVLVNQSRLTISACGTATTAHPARGSGRGPAQGVHWTVWRDVPRHRRPGSSAAAQVSSARVCAFRSLGLARLGACNCMRALCLAPQSADVPTSPPHPRLAPDSSSACPLPTSSRSIVGR